jgi:hypothetical protein
VIRLLGQCPTLTGGGARRPGANTARRPAAEAAIDLHAVPGVGADLVLSVDGELQRTRLYRAHEQAELSGAIADTRAMFEAKGWM